jgi:hypothetical protein
MILRKIMIMIHVIVVAACFIVILFLCLVVHPYLVARYGKDFERPMEIRFTLHPEEVAPPNTESVDFRSSP